MNVRGFLDVGFNVSSADDGRDDSFALGQFNLVLTSRLTERAYFLAETYFIGGTVLYKTNRLELLGEVFNIYHDDHTSDQIFDSLGPYAQAAYVVKDVMPYYRFDVLNFGGPDPYYSSNVVDVHKHTLGTRWDFLPWNALKVECAFANFQADDDEHLLSVNLSFAF
ncbi:MAG: hypothetical protein AB1451_08250 [Nitrospirota bacterium]